MKGMTLKFSTFSYNGVRIPITDWRFNERHYNVSGFLHKKDVTESLNSIVRKKKVVIENISYY